MNKTGLYHIESDETFTRRASTIKGWLNWIVDWRTKTVEIYELDYADDKPAYYLWKTISQANKDELKIIHFPNIKITFDELFEEID